MQRFVEEIRKRSILRAVGAYGVGVWLILQVASVVSDPWGMPSWVMQFLIVVAIIGFPITIVISWFYEWTCPYHKPHPERSHENRVMIYS